MSKTILYGASGHAKVILDAMKLRSIEDIVLVDDNPEIRKLAGYQVVQAKTLNIMEDHLILISIGNNSTRKKIVEKFNGKYFNVIHPSAIIAHTVKVGLGTFIAAGAIINPETVVGNHVIINTSASIDHDCKIGNFVHVAPNATLCGTVRVGEGTLVGAGVTVIPNIKIGKWATIGAGSVIIEDIPDHAVVVGNPGKVIRINA